MDVDFDFPAAGNAADKIDMEEDTGLPEVDPILKVGDEKEIGKDGLKKKLLHEGQGWENPNSGDEVEGIISLYDEMWLLIFFN